MPFKHDLPDNLVEGRLDIRKLHTNRHVFSMGVSLSTFNSVVSKDTCAIAFDSTLVIMDGVTNMFDST